MSKTPHDNQKVVSFIKQYRPLPPPGTATLETQLLTKIAQKSSHYHSRNIVRRWLIPSALVASLTAIWGGYRWLQPSYQFSDNSTNIELFLVESWQGTMEQSSLYSDWLLLQNPEREYLVSHP